MRRSVNGRRPARRRVAVATVGAAVALTTLAVGPAGAGYAAQTSSGASTTDAAGRACPPAAAAVSFSDALDKLSFDGATVGGLSSLAFDWRSNAWASTVDNNGVDPARIWFFRNLGNPTVVRDPLVLRRPDGTPYDGTNSDNEGLAVLPDGDYLVSSETEPSIRIFGRDGVQKASLPVPARFGVTGKTPAGEATNNATLEGLTISPDGREVVAAMEGALSGDVSPSGDATFHRFLVYDAGPHGTWRLAKEIGYRTEAGQRVPEVAAYGNDSLLVEEASFSTTTGNAVTLYAVTGRNKAKDVSDVANLSEAPSRDIVGKQLVANLVDCPTLGAPSKETQTNPLLDNYEGMAITFGGDQGGDRDVRGRRTVAGVSLISDDNFSPNQFTRVVNLVAILP